MTKKDYIAFAETIRKTLAWQATDDGMVPLSAVIRAVGDTFKADNGRFDRDRFEAACRG